MLTESTAESVAGTVDTSSQHLKFMQVFFPRLPKLLKNSMTAMNSSQKTSNPKANEEVKNIADDYGEDSDTRLRKFYEEAEPGRSYTLKEIAEAMGVTRERVRQIEEMALRKFGRRFRQILKRENIDPEEFQR
tara:strand:- start:371 stop:769 length:399 start_codon:yes stop_codon:yes gene_type:complete